MSENIQNKPHNQPEKPTEIDLGELFKMIGRGINRFLAFLRNTFLFILDLIIRALIVVRVHFVKFAIVGFLSISIGWFIDARRENVYIATMFVEANYGSTRQLYSNITYYNSLAMERDSATLADIFKIDKSNAAKLRGFYIDPDVTENGLLEAYSDFMKKADSTIVKDQIDFSKFKNNISHLSFKVHRISVYSAERKVIPKLQPSLVSYRLDNEYIKKNKELLLENLEREEESLKEQLKEIDDLGEVYKEILLKDPVQKEGRTASTYIQMASNNEKTTKELEMLERNQVINKRILQVRLERESGRETINVLSDFSQKGKVERFYDSYLFKIPLVTLTLLLLFILLRELNTYLNTYSENKRLNA